MEGNSIKIDNIDQIKSNLSKYHVEYLTAVYGDAKFNTKRSKKFIVCVSYFGIHFFRCGLFQRDYNQKKFISHYDVLEIKYIDEKSRCICCKNESIIVISDHISYIQHYLLYMNSYIFYDSVFAYQVLLSGFIKGNPQVPIMNKRSNNLSKIRYLAYCMKYEEIPDENTVLLLKWYGRSIRTAILFSEFHKSHINFKIILKSLSHEKSLSFLILDNYFSDYVGVLIGNITYYLRNIQLICMKNYNFPSFTSIPWRNTEMDKALSLSLSNCQFSNIVDLLTQISGFPGVIQKFEIENIFLNQKTVEALCQLIVRSRCFSTLEVLSLKNISTDQKNSNSYFKTLCSYINELPRLVKFEAQNWSPYVTFPIVHEESSFNIFPNSRVQCLFFSGLSMIKVIGSTVFPNNIREIRLPFCGFNFKSLYGFIKSLSNIKNTFILDISEMAIKKEDLEKFYDCCSSLPSIPNIVEMIWNRNKLPKAFISNFKRIFVNDEITKFLSISFIYRQKTIKTLMKLISSLTKTHIWGFEIKGDKETALGNSIVSVINCLSKIKSLGYLDISNHGLEEVEIMNCIQALKSSKLLRELIIDGTSIQNIPAFYGFYQNILAVPSITSFSVPQKDMKRIFSNSLLSELNHERFFAFKERFCLKQRPASINIRSDFYNMNNDMNMIKEFEAVYPFSLSSFHSIDGFWLNSPTISECFVKSLHDMSFPTNNLSLLFSQRTVSSSLNVPPFFSINQDIFVPKNIRPFFKRESIQQQNSPENQKDLNEEDLKPNNVNKEIFEMLEFLEERLDEIKQMRIEGEFVSIIPISNPTIFLSKKDFLFIKKSIINDNESSINQGECLYYSFNSYQSTKDIPSLEIRFNESHFENLDSYIMSKSFIMRIKESCSKLVNSELSNEIPLNLDLTIRPITDELCDSFIEKIKKDFFESTIQVQNDPIIVPIEFQKTQPFIPFLPPPLEEMDSFANFNEKHDNESEDYKTSNGLGNDSLNSGKDVKPPLITNIPTFIPIQEIPLLDSNPSILNPNIRLIIPPPIVSDTLNSMDQTNVSITQSEIPNLIPHNMKASNLENIKPIPPPLLTSAFHGVEDVTQTAKAKSSFNALPDIVFPSIIPTNCSEIDSLNTQFIDTFDLPTNESALNQYDISPHLPALMTCDNFYDAFIPPIPLPTQEFTLPLLETTDEFISAEIPSGCLSSDQSDTIDIDNIPIITDESEDESDDNPSLFGMRFLHTNYHTVGFSTNIVIK